MNTMTDNLPEYAVTVTECGDPQPVIDELTEWLDEQAAPQILAWIEQPNEGEPEPAEPEFAEGETDNPVEGEPEPAEGETDETSGAGDD